MTRNCAQRDATISNDGEGPNALNADFNTYWDVVTQITDDGWFAEVRIPFSSLGFQDENGRVEMGLLFQRGSQEKMNGSPFPKFQPMFQGRFSNPLWDSGWYLKEFTAAARFICPPTFLVASIRFTPSMQMRRVIQEWMIPRWMPDSMLNMGLQIISRSILRSIPILPR